MPSSKNRSAKIARSAAPAAARPPAAAPATAPPLPQAGSSASGSPRKTPVRVTNVIAAVKEASGLKLHLEFVQRDRIHWREEERQTLHGERSRR